MLQMELEFVYLDEDLTITFNYEPGACLKSCLKTSFCLPQYRRQWKLARRRSNINRLGVVGDLPVLTDSIPVG